MEEGSDRSVTGRPATERSNEERIKRIKRKADPWYRRVIRIGIQLGLLVAIIGGVAFVVRAVVESETKIELPPPGGGDGVIRSTTITLTLGPPTDSAPGVPPSGPGVAGTVIVDPATGAFEFSGSADGPQRGLDIAGRLGIATFVRSTSTGGEWRVVIPGGVDDASASAVERSVRAVADAASVDEILTDTVRGRYVTLLAAETIDDERLGRSERFDLEIDTERFADEFPLRWHAFETGAVPGAPATSALPVSVRLSDDRILLEVVADSVGWSWRRLSWSADPFVPAVLVPDPSTYTIRAACTSKDGRLVWETTFASCQEALDAARGLADQTGATTILTDGGLPDAAVTERIESAVPRLCAAMENPFQLTPVDAWEVPFGAALVAAAVCIGDPTILVP